MTTLNELIYSILLTIRPYISDDENVARRLIAFEIHSQRALWLRNEFNKNRTIDPAFIQDLGCVELERTDTAECCEITSDCLILKTVQKIPNTIERHNSTTITRIGPVDKMSVSFSLVPYGQAIFAGNGRFNKNEVFAFLRNGHIYIKTNNKSLSTFMKYVNIQGVFENPTEAANFLTCDNAPCYDDNSAYPINKWLVPYITAEVIKKMAPSAQQPVDKSNDASSSLSQPIEK